MNTNSGVAYIEPGKVEVQEIEFPKLELGARKCEHGVILKVVATNAVAAATAKKARRVSA